MAKSGKPWIIIVASVIAVLFGALTIYSGGRALFGGPEARAAVGNAVAFVLWFNFSAGFLYILAGIGIYLQRPWAVWLAAVIALATILVFGAFGFHIWSGGPYELRTVGAMALRSLVWVGLALICIRKIRGTGN